MIDLDDIQSLIVRPSKHSTVAIYFVRLQSRKGMRLFLERAAGLVTTATEMTDAIAEQGDNSEPPPTVSIAVSAAGLDLAGIDPRARSALAPAFVEGMRAAAHRLGDVGASDPSQWRAPFDIVPGIDGAAPIHAAVIVHGSLSPAKRDAVERCLGSGCDAGENASGDEQVWTGARRGNGFEPFGFRDNVSDPGIEGSGKAVTPGNGVWDAKAGRWRAARAGEALIGYVDESEALAGHPDAAHIERNGSYLVLRKLEQDVERFWRECAEWAEDLWPTQPEGGGGGTDVGASDDAELHDDAAGDPDGDGGDAPDPRADPTWPVAVLARTTNAGKVAAQLVGRTWTGAVLHQPEEIDDPDAVPPNDFLYRDHVRSDGITVPPSAHIRRSNPRDGIGAALQLVPRHLLFRRGIPYYEPEHTIGRRGRDEQVPASRGLLFMACCADLRRQFEFVQSHWLQDGSRFGLGRERDPLTGTRPLLPPPGAPQPDPSYPDVPGEGDEGGENNEDIEGDDGPETLVSIDHGGARCRRPLSGFVTTRGGEYFLLPSRSALLLLGDPDRT